MSPTVKHAAAVCLILIAMNASATEFMKKGSAIADTLGTKQVKAQKVKVKGKDVQVFFSQKDGKPDKLAVVQSMTYPPDCTHTWVIGLTAKTAQVEGIKVVEMKCPHAYPTNKASFLDQYKGKGPADVKTLKASVATIAKATGTSELTTDAVLVAIQAAQGVK